MADATLANAPAETRVVTWANDDEQADVLVDYFWRKPQALQNLLRRNPQGFMTAVVDPLRDNLETRRKMTQFKLEAALRDRHSDRGNIQGLHDRLEVMEKLLKIKPEADPPRPSRSAEARGDNNFHLEVRDGKGVDTEADQEVAKIIAHLQRRAQWRRTKIMDCLCSYSYKSVADQALIYKVLRERWRRKDLRSSAFKKMKRIRELQERGNGATLDQLGEVFMQRCKSSASRDALARLLAASDGSVGTSASASGSSEASSGSGGGVPSPAAAARRKGSTLQWLGDVPADAEGEPPSKKMKQAGPTEDDNQK